MGKSKQTQVIIKGRLPGERVDLFLKLTGELPSKKNIAKQNLLFNYISKTQQATIERIRKYYDHAFNKKEKEIVDEALDYVSDKLKKG